MRKGNQKRQERKDAPYHSNLEERARHYPKMG